MIRQSIINILLEKNLINDNKIKQLDDYQKILKSENNKMNLTSIVEIDEVYEKHFFDCSTVLFNSDLKNKKILDIGSGAGFPGIVLKILEPTIELVIIEALQKRVNFLNKLINELNLKNITVIHGRAEDEAINFNEQFDYATFRAVAKLNIMSELVVKYLKINGEIIALKGKNGLAELHESESALQKLNLKVVNIEKLNLPIEKSERIIIKIKKEKKTPSQYPRMYSKIKKNPL